MNRRARAKGKMHPRNDEGRVVNHAVWARATRTMTSWTSAKTDASERAGKPSAGKRACVCVCVCVSVQGERMEGKYRKLDRGLESWMTQLAVSGCSRHVRIAVFDKTDSSINLNPASDNASWNTRKFAILFALAPSRSFDVISAMAIFPAR